MTYKITNYNVNECKSHICQLIFNYRLKNCGYIYNHNRSPNPYLILLRDGNYPRAISDNICDSIVNNICQLIQLIMNPYINLSDKDFRNAVLEQKYLVVRFSTNIGKIIVYNN